MKLNFKIGNFVNGKWNTSADGETLTVKDKYSQEPIAQVPLATETDIEEAIVGSEAGFLALRAWSTGKRVDHLSRLRSLLAARLDEIAQIIVQEAGKPLSYAEGEVKRCLATLDSALAEGRLFTGETVPIDFGAGEGKVAFTSRIPIGPILCITPFNFPLNLVLHKVAPALMVGCSVIIKPAPQAPLSAIFLANLIEEAGYPAGVVNVVNCSVALAEQLVRDDRIAMVSFTGSEKVGWHIKNVCGRKKVALELGGNAAVIIDKGTDTAKIAKSVASGAFLYAGQICISTQRILVHQSIFAEFKEQLVTEIKALKVGDPSIAATSVGPLIGEEHVKRVSDWVNEAKSQGAEVLTGGQIQDSKHNIYQPTLLTKTNSTMKVCQEEIFGPVAIIEEFSDFDDAIKKANDSKFGLQAGVYTNDFANVKKSHQKLEVGGVIINSVPGFRVDNMPYGGVKMSGLGREGSKYTMQEMTEPRLIVY